MEKLDIAKDDINKVTYIKSKKQSHLETIVNQCIGLFLGWMIVYALFPLFNHLKQEYVATISTIIFFISSYARTYLVRRYFNGIYKSPMGKSKRVL
jgi:hypothetical protein